MSTPAKARLDKLFANSPLPPGPHPPKSVQAGAGVVSKVIPQDPGTTTDTAAQYSQQMDNQHHSATTREDILAGSDDEDDDEYAAAFSKKSKKKANPLQCKYKPGQWAAGNRKGGDVKSSKSIKFLPRGKVPLHQTHQDSAATRFEETVNQDGTGQSIACEFCLFSLVAKFPYKYMEDSDNRVSRHFFADSKIYQRPWDIHYLHTPESFATGPLILVPCVQVKQLLYEISSTFDIDLPIPPFPFSISFHDDGTPQPMFLQTSHNRQEMNAIQGNIPEPASKHGECPPKATSALVSSFRRWHEKCVQVQDASKKGKSASRNKKTSRLQQSTQEKYDQLNRAQRYLGLRPRMKSVDDMSGLSWNEKNDFIQQQLNQSLVIKFLNVQELAQYEFDGQAVVISIDVESYERNHALITEVGISTLDTIDLLNMTPGDTGKNWTQLIRSRHFLIKGRENLVNREFVSGCPEAFQFGVSERVDLDQVADSVDDCFEWPFSIQFKHDGKFRPQAYGSHRPSEDDNVQKGSPSAQKGPKQRNIILLGHDIDADITYLSKLGSSIFGRVEVSSDKPAPKSRQHVLASMLEVLDTAALFQSMTSETQPRSLAALCDHLGIDSWHLHNAGNDARYTLESFVKLVIKSRQIQDEATIKANSDSKACTEDQQECERVRRIDERMTHTKRQLEYEFKELENARKQGTASPKLISSSFINCQPILVKKDMKPVQTPADREEAFRSWCTTQGVEDDYKWGESSSHNDQVSSVTGSFNQMKMEGRNKPYGGW